MFVNLIKSKWRSIVVFLVDVCALLVSYQVVLARHGLYSFSFTRYVRTSTLLLILLSVIAMRLLFGVYLHVWRYATSDVYLNMVIADILGGAIFYAIDRLVLKTYLPAVTSVAAIATGLLATLSARFLYTYIRHARSRVRLEKARAIGGGPPQIPVGIIGAGQLGVLLVNELRASPISKYIPVCFFDNDQRKIGMTIEGLKVYGPDEEAVKKLKQLPIQAIIATLPSLSLERRQQVFDTYMKTGLKVMVYDYPVERLGDASEKPQIRDIDVSDLLFREPVVFSDADARVHYKGKIILVTGAGGSIGSEICRQVAQLEPRRLLMLDVYENGVFDLCQELSRQHPKLNMEIIIATVCDPVRMDRVFLEHKPDIVFHAAAHKHVPLMESNCAEAIQNNVFGTLHVVQAAEKAKVSRFVLISTDKAVNPTNIMGATKRVCEMIVQSRESEETDFVAVRFGNVLGSNGSVVPLFQRQISEGGPITITDKEITRYFMTIPEAAQLVLRTGRRAERSEIYVLDMGDPIRIYDLALKMIALTGLVPGQDIEIKEVGLRPGEKLYEELLVKPEDCHKTEDKRIFIERSDPPESQQVQQVLDLLKQALDQQLGDDALRDVMVRCVPTYTPFGLE